MKTSNLIVYLFFISSSCVEPISVSNIFQPMIVVEGLITDQPGPYLVKISRALPISPVDQLDKPRFESGATVVIQDDQGNSETLTEKSSGNYYTSSLQGTIGRTYTLSITTSDGHTYQSAAEKMLPVGDFTNLRYTFVQNEPPPFLFGRDQYGFQWTSRTLFYSRNVHTTNGFMVYLDAEVIPEQENRIWWRWNGTFEIIAYPIMQVEYVTDPVTRGAALVPDVDRCSGFTTLNRHTIAAHLSPVGPCTCCTCWATESNTVPLISDARFINNGKINDFNVAFIEANRRTFYEKYYLEVEQLSISVDVYNFWKNIKIQKRNSSNLFQTPPPKTGGNVTPSSTNSMPVIGYFAASAIKKHSIMIDRSAVPFDVGIIDTLAFDCKKAYQYSSDIKPPFW
jgi:hypothetical protein